MDLGASVGYELGRIVNIRTEAGEVEKCRPHAALLLVFKSSLRLTADRKIFFIDPNAPANWLFD
jgi:hypothetical protein